MSEILLRHRQFCNYSLAFKGNTERTIKWFKETMRYFINDTGVENLSEIDRQTIQEYILHGKFEKGWSAKTIHNRIGALRSFLKWCVKEGLIDSDPTTDIDLPRIEKRIPEHLPLEKALELLDWTKNYRYAVGFERARATAIIGIFIYTGIRLGELLNLKMEGVRIDERAIHIRMGKGKKDRFIPINDKLFPILDSYIKERDRLNRHCPHFIVSLRHDRKIGEKAIDRLVEKLRNKSGIYFYPHMLRHTFAMMMLKGGADIYAISKMMGHSDIKTTTIYLSATVDHLRSEIEKHAA